MALGAISDPQGWPDLYGDYLYRFALLRIREAQVAEDMVQETFLAALQGRGRFAGQSTERSWLVGIMKHKIVDHFRKVTREIPTDDMERVVAGEDVGSAFDQHGHWKPGASAPMNWPDNPSGALEQKQFWDVLKQCLDELPPRMAQVFSLREVDEVSSEEIRAMLGITPNNLWVLLHRSRRHLRQCLETHHFGPRLS